MTDNLRAHAIIRGKVQGVCFRIETQRSANRFGVKGWVRNKRDGTVEALFEGHKESVENIIDWCKKGPPASKVDNVSVDWEQFKGEYNTFQITY